MCKRIIGLTLNCILVLAGVGDLAAGDATLIPDDDQGVKEKLAEVQRQGIGANKAANLEGVESLRLERYRILEEYLKKHPDSKSPWVKGVKALNIVDGDSEAIKAVAPGGESKLGLVEQCKYKEAYETLVAAFRDTQKDGTEWPFGDLAVRAVEVVHQAAGILTLEVVQDDSAANKEFIATNEELLALLEDAEADKLCLLAGIYKQWLSPPDPAESYLRAELRDNFRDRQKVALELSHPLSLVPVRERSQPDNRDVPVAPYHGAVEILKSRAIKWLVEDLNDTYVLAPDFTTDDYVLPGVIIDCQDAAGSPLQIVYGRQLLCRMVDENGLTRTAFIFYDDEEQKWSQRYLSLLYLVPRDASVLTDDQRSVQSLLVTLPEERSIKLGADVIKQYAYPNDATADLLRTNTKILRVADIWELTDTTFRASGNNPAHISDCLTEYLQESRNGRDRARKIAEARRDPLKISPAVYVICKALELENDSTQHPLVRLLGVRTSEAGEQANVFQKLGLRLSVMTPDELKARDLNEYNRLLRNRRDGDRWMKRQEAVRGFLKTHEKFKLNEGVSLNPLLVVSDVDDTVAEPLWFREFRDGEAARYLVSPKFGKVFFRQDPTDFSKSWFEFGVRGATVHYPLSIGAVPGQVILGTNSGRILLAALEEAGYGRPEALAEVAKIWQSFGEDLPRKLEDYLAAKQRSSADVSALEGALKPPLNYMNKYGFRYIVDPRDNVIMNSGLTGNAVSSTGNQSLFTYVDKDGNEVPVSQHYSDNDYSDLHRNVYMEHLSKAVAYFPCPETCYWFHRERLRPLFNPSGRIPPYLVGWSKTNGEDDMFRVDLMSYSPDLDAASTSPENALDSVRSELPMPASYLSSDRCRAILGKEPGGPELRGLNRLAGFIASLWAVPFAQDFPIRANDLTAFKTKAAPGFSRRDMLRHLLRYSARENARWEDSHASIVLYNDLLSFNFAEIEQWSDSEEFLKGGSNSPHVPVRRMGGFGESFSRRRLRQLFGKGGNVFQLVPDTQAGADLADQISGAVNREADKVELLLELAGVLSRTRYRATAARIWDEVVASKSLYLDPFIQESRLYFEAYGLQLGRQVERALERYTELVGVADARRGGVQHSEGVAPASGTGVVNERLDAIVEDYLSFEPAQIQRGLDREQLERYTFCSKELQKLKAGASFSEWLKAVNRLIERPEAIIARRYEFSPRLFLPLEYDSEKGFATAALDEFVREVSEIVLADPVLFERGGWTPEGEDGIRIASLMAWYFLEAGRFSDARRAYTLASAEYFRLAKEASQRKREREALVFQLNAYRQLCGRESVVYRSPGCCASSVRIYAGVYGPMLMWERRWFAEGLEGSHARLARSEMLRLFDQIENEIESRKLERDDRRIFFADYRSVLGGAIPEPVLFLALNSSWFRDIKTAEERVADLEAATDAIDAGDEEGKKAHGEKLKNALELRDGLFETIFDEIINVRATGLDEEVAKLR